MINGFVSLGPAIARGTSTFEVAGNHQVALGDTSAALNKNIGTTSSLDSYDSAVEDAQRREPKRAKETFVTPQKPLLDELKACARPSKAAKLNSPPAAKAPSPKPTTGPTRLNSQESSPGPSASDVAPAGPKTKGKRSKSPTYWRTRLNVFAV